LGDDHLQAERQLDALSTGNLDGFDFALEFEGGMHGGGGGE
jgi:hypothetical protein